VVIRRSNATRSTNPLLAANNEEAGDEAQTEGFFQKALAEGQLQGTVQHNDASVNGLRCYRNSIGSLMKSQYYWHSLACPHAPDSFQPGIRWNRRHG
jgi:hypothetical protein